MSVLVQRLGLSSTGNRATWTFSAWVKRSRNVGSSSEFIFSSNTERTGGGEYSSIYFENDCLSYYDYYSSAKQKYLHTNRKFRDLNAWYHIVVRVDTTQSTASDRIRFYVNGVQETSFSSSSYPTQNDNSSYVNWSGADNFVGTQTNNLSAHFLGSMSHVYLCDGQSYAPTVFGSTDATTGEWKINADPTVSYGTNGFFLFKNDNVVTDQSGQGNNFSIGSGTLTKTEDSPSNIFCTWNPLDFTPPNPPNTVYANGNTSVTTSASTGSSSDVWGTLGAVSGKYYYEIKMTNNPSDSNNTGMAVGWGNSETQERITYYSGNGYQYYDSGSAAYGNTYTQNDIIGCAVDLTNGTIEFYKNGTSQGSITNRITTNTGFWKPLTWDGSGSLTASWNANFGNGYFGTTAVSSAGTNASGIGIFEYDVPTGYTALSTKGLNL